MDRNIRLVIADIDGTLTNSNALLTDNTKEAINELHANGYLFGIASGRSIDSQLIHYASNWGFDWQFDVIIGMNGGELYDGINQKRYNYHPLKKEWIKEIIEMLEPLDVNPFLYVGKEMLCVKNDDGIVASSIRNNMPYKICKDASEMYQHDNSKLLVRVSEDFMPTLQKWVEDHPSKYYRGFKTQTIMFEFMDKRVNKGLSLKKFCQMNKIDLASVVSFGDIQNDNELLKVAGTGVCMLNGADETKAYANRITDKTNDEDGFADYVRKYILG